MSRQYWSEGIAWATEDGTAIANTTTETEIFPSPTIPANFIADGRQLRLKAYGKYSTTGTPTLAFGLRWGSATGGVSLAASEPFTTPTGAAILNWAIDLVLQVRTNGSTGTVIVMGTAVLQTNDSADPTHKMQVFGVGGGDDPATATVDLTVDTALTLTATWGTASASNTLTGLIYTLDAPN